MVAKEEIRKHTSYNMRLYAMGGFKCVGNLHPAL